METFFASMPDVLATTIRMTVPLLFVALGELFSERAGLVNIGLDGLMTIGAFTALWWATRPATSGSAFYAAPWRA